MIANYVSLRERIQKQLQTETSEMHPLQFKHWPDVLMGIFAEYLSYVKIYAVLEEHGLDDFMKFYAPGALSNDKPIVNPYRFMKAHPEESKQAAEDFIFNEFCYLAFTKEGSWTVLHMPEEAKNSMTARLFYAVSSAFGALEKELWDTLKA